MRHDVRIHICMFMSFSILSNLLFPQGATSRWTTSGLYDPSLQEQVKYVFTYVYTHIRIHAYICTYMYVRVWRVWLWRHKLPHGATGRRTHNGIVKTVIRTLFSQSESRQSRSLQDINRTLGVVDRCVPGGMVHAVVDRWAIDRQWHKYCLYSFPMEIMTQA